MFLQPSVKVVNGCIINSNFAFFLFFFLSREMMSTIILFSFAVHIECQNAEQNLLCDHNFVAMKTRFQCYDKHFFKILNKKPTTDGVVANCTHNLSLENVVEVSARKKCAQ